MKLDVKKLVQSALFVAIGILLPMVFHSIQGAGAIFLPMHIPVLICGLYCGYKYGALCGLITPLLSSLLTQMPPIYPTGVAMTLELMTYGTISGLLHKKYNVFLSLILSMLAGRAVSGIANTILFGLAGKPYGLETFLTASFVKALPGIVIQLIFIPIIVTLLEKRNFLREED